MLQHILINVLSDSLPYLLCNTIIYANHEVLCYLVRWVQEIAHQQWIIAAKEQIHVFDASQAEAEQEEQRLQALLQQRQAELEEVCDTNLHCCF